MNPVIAAAIAQGLGALLEIWRNQSNKPADWVPSQQEWDDLLALNEKSAEQYKAEAAARLGIPWPSVMVPPPNPA